MLVCGPDYVTQADLYCTGWIRPPAKISAPLRPDAEVSAATQRGPLADRGGWCRQKLKRGKVVAVVHRCGDQIRIDLRGDLSVHFDIVGSDLTDP